MFSQSGNDDVVIDVNEKGRHSPSPPTELSRIRSIPKRDLKIGDHVASGSFGSVHKAEWRQLDVAVKLLRQNKNGQDFTEEQKKELEEEVRIVSNKPHRHIVQVYGFCRELNCFVMDYFSNGSVEGMIHRNPEKRAEASKLLWRLTTAESVASAMDALHQPPTVIHRDLKSSNVFASLYNVVRVGDFGKAKHLAELQDISSDEEERRGKYAPMMINHAPELINAYLEGHHRAFSKSSDVFSFGLFLQEILEFERPYGISAYNSEEVWPRVLAVGRGSLLPEVNEEKARNLDDWYPCAEPIFDVFRNCVKFDPGERLEFHEIHRQIKKIREDVQAVIAETEEADTAEPHPGNHWCRHAYLGYIVLLLALFIIYAYPDICELYKGTVTWKSFIINLVAVMVLFWTLWSVPRCFWAQLKKCPIECQEALIRWLRMDRRRPKEDDTLHSLHSQLKAAPIPDDWPKLRAGLLANLNPDSDDIFVVAVFRFCEMHQEDVLSDKDWMTLKEAAFRSTAVLQTDAWGEYERTSGIHMAALEASPPDYLSRAGQSTPFKTSVCNSWLSGSKEIFGNAHEDIELESQTGQIGRSEVSYCPPGTPEYEGSRCGKGKPPLYDLSMTRDDDSRYGRSESSVHDPKIAKDEGCSGE